MTAIAVLVQPIDRATGQRINIRATSHDRTWATRMGGDIWVPAITGRPRIESQFFEGSFESPITAASATLQFSLSNVIDYLEAVGASAIKDLSWRGAPVTIYSGREGDSWPWRIALEGQVNDFTERDGQAQIPVQVDEEPFQADLLTRQYAGTTGAEGPIDLRDDLKPLVIGYCKNVEPVLIDAIDNVWQFSGYGTIQSVDALYERASLFVPAGTPVPDYDDYDALVAADIAPGLWATCLAEGMIRLGAPAAGLITGDVRGHVFAQGYADKPGLLSRRLLDLAGIASDRVNAAAFDAIDAAISTWPNQGRVGASVTGQTTLLDMVHRLVSNANAIATIGNDGRISAHRITFDDAPAITLDTSGRRLPVVIDSEETAAQLPFKRYVVGADISWRVHDPASEIAFQADIIDRGRYDGAETYREGHIVDLADGSRWLYVNPVPSSGNTPQTGSLHWSRLSGPVDAQTVGGAAAADIVDGAGRANLGLAPDGAVNQDLKPSIIAGSNLVTRGGGGGNFVGDLDATFGATRDEANRIVRAQATADSKTSTFFADTLKPEDVFIDERGRRYFRKPDNEAALVLDGEPILLDGEPVLSSWRRIDPVVSLDDDNGLRIQDSVGNFRGSVDLLNFNRRRIVNPPEVMIDLAPDGEVLTNFPITVSLSALTGNQDVSAQTQFSAQSSPSISASINNQQGVADRGNVTITDYAGAGTITVSAIFDDGLREVSQIRLVERKAPNPITGGSGAAMVVDENWSNISSADFVRVTDDEMTVQSTSDGALRFRYSAGFLSSNQSSAVNVEAVCRFRLAGSTDEFQNAGSVLQGSGSFFDAEFQVFFSGFISQQEFSQTGLDASTDYEVGLFVRRISGAGGVVFSSSDSIFQVRQ